MQMPISLVILWCAGVILQILVLFQGAWGSFFAKYPFFYASVAFSWLAGIIAFYVIPFFPRFYVTYYWTSEFSTMVVACGNIFEVLRHAFSPTVSARTLVRVIKYLLVGGTTLFLVAVLFIPGSWGIRFVALERDFRAFQAAIMLALLAGVFYLGLFLQREIKSILCGYALYIGMSLASRTLETRFWIYPYKYDALWRALDPVCYDISLVIYLVGFSSLRFSRLSDEHVESEFFYYADPADFARAAGERDD